MDMECGSLLPLFFPARPCNIFRESRLARLRKNQFKHNRSLWPQEKRRQAAALQARARLSEGQAEACSTKGHRQECLCYRIVWRTMREPG